MSTLRLTTISNQDGSATVPSQTVISGSAKAWVNFNGTGTVAIRAGFNVTSITDNGVGNYTVNFTNAFSDANYAVFANGSISGVTVGMQQNQTVAPTTTTCNFVSYAPSNGASNDPSLACVSFFR